MAVVHKYGRIRFDEVYSGNDLDAFIREYYPRLMGYATTLLDPDSAKDVVQDVFLYIWEHRHSIHIPDKENGLKSYIFTACHSRMIDYIRKSSKLDIIESEKLKRMAEDRQWLENNQKHVISALYSKDLLKIIDKTLETMPENRHKVFRLSFFGGLTNDEISLRMEIPKRTVEGHLYLALKELRKTLPAYFHIMTSMIIFIQ